MAQNPSSSRADRKTIEKNRRDYMKSLYSELYSTIPHQASRPAASASLPDQLDEAVNYIKNLRSNLEKMKEKKEGLLFAEENQDINDYSKVKEGETLEDEDFPKIEIHEKGSALEVILITGMDNQFIFSETIRILHEEGVEVINASFTVLDRTVFHTIHTKVGEPELDNTMQTTRISERLKNFVYGCRLVITHM